VMTPCLLLLGERMRDRRPKGNTESLNYSLSESPG